jgi:PhnB protein
MVGLSNPWHPVRQGVTKGDAMQVQPYLMFHGRCEEAVEFYRSAIGAQGIELMRFRDAPDPPPPGAIPAGFESKIMHGTFRVGDTTVMVSDGSRDTPVRFEGFSLVIGVSTEAEADRVFDALAQGGQIGMPLAKTFWSPRFGTLTDRFGVSWMINTAP